MGERKRKREEKRKLVFTEYNESAVVVVDVVGMEFHLWRIVRTGTEYLQRVNRKTQEER